MQEEVEQKVVTLIVNCSKLTEQELRKALAKLLEQMKTARHTQKLPQGKMTVKQLAAQNKGMQSIEVSSKTLGSFNRIARKYGSTPPRSSPKKIVPPFSQNWNTSRHLSRTPWWTGPSERSWDDKTSQLQETDPSQHSLCVHRPVCHQGRTGCAAGSRF